MAKFADYGFNKSHAAAYALVSYQTAYLRANHPGGVSGGLHELWPSPIPTSWPCCGRMPCVWACKVLPPDVNKSGGFSARNLGGRHACHPLRAGRDQARRRRGDGGVLRGARRKTFCEDLADFAARIDAKTITRGQIEILAKAGAFDACIPTARRFLRWPKPSCARAQAQAEERESGQIGLFGGRPSLKKSGCPQLPDWPETDRLAFEAEAIGFHISAHPLDMYALALKRLGVVPSARHRAPGAGRRHADQTRRHRGREEGAHHPHRQPHDVGDACRTCKAVSRSRCSRKCSGGSGNAGRGHGAAGDRRYQNGR
jgi:DNA polymerase-3 subunit alpha